MKAVATPKANHAFAPKLVAVDFFVCLATSTPVAVTLGEAALSLSKMPP